VGIHALIRYHTEARLSADRVRIAPLFVCRPAAADTGRTRPAAHVLRAAVDRG
jgi:hypothetical protein